jgi:transcriptional regulator with XRE-family HTH domain
MDAPEEPRPDKDPLLAAVGERVRELREVRRMTPSEMARAAGFTQQYLWRLEDGQQNLSLRTIARIALALDVPMTALLQDIEPGDGPLGRRPYRPRKSATDAPPTGGQPRGTAKGTSRATASSTARPPRSPTARSTR